MGNGKKVIFFLIDGLADKPVDNKTPLTEANKPNIDYFAKNGVCGELKVLPKNIYPDSELASFSILGYNYKRYKINRGPLEAIGSDLNYKNGWLALRCNLATVNDELIVIDRRAGRNFLYFKELCRFLNDNVKLNVDFSFNHTFGHRAVLIIKSNLSDKITSNDPRKEGEKVKAVQALDKEALVSAKIVQEFIEKSYEILKNHELNKERAKRGLLPANYILFRGAGNYIDNFPNFCKKYKIRKALCIAENGAIKGLCIQAGFNCLTIPETTFEKSLDFIFSNLVNATKEYDLVLVHVKNIDEPGHDGNFELKKKMIEEMDKRFYVLKDFDGILAITCDHITSTSDKSHLPGKVPLLIYGKGRDKVEKFDEISVKKGKLKNYTPNKMWEFVFGK
jgi:2,3-bisphosphoglycerate-independent phosphoglycerate mutase